MAFPSPVAPKHDTHQNNPALSSLPPWWLGHVPSARSPTPTLWAQRVVWSLHFPDSPARGSSGSWRGETFVQAQLRWPEVPLFCVPWQGVHSPRTPWDTSLPLLLLALKAVVASCTDQSLGDITDPFLFLYRFPGCHPLRRKCLTKASAVF